MAGSYKHVVDDKGRLLSPTGVCNMLNIPGSPEAWGSLAARDVCEAIQEMYGMIWYLADQVASSEMLIGEHDESDVRAAIEEAQLNYKIGLEKSPGVGPGWDRVGPWKMYR